MPPLSRSTIAATEGDAALGVLATRRNHGQPHQAAVPRRPRRQPAAPARSARRARAAEAGQDHAGGAAHDRGRGDPAGGQDAGGDRPASRHRRRVPPRLLAHGFPLPGRRRHQGEDNLKIQFKNEEGVIEFTPAALRVTGKLRLEKRDLRRRFPVPEVGDQGDAEADDPVAEHDALPRRPRRDRRDGLSGPGGVLGRSRPGLRRRDRGAAQARLHVPAARRHEPRLSQRSGAARAHHQARRQRRAPAPHLYPPDQRGAGQQARRHDGVHAYVPRQFPLVVGAPRAATTTSPRRCSANSRSTASSWSTTTRAPAASSRCASCPRARWSCSAW